METEETQSWDAVSLVRFLSSVIFPAVLLCGCSVLRYKSSSCISQFEPPHCTVPHDPRLNTESCLSRFHGHTTHIYCWLLFSQWGIFAPSCVWGLCFCCCWGGGYSVVSSYLCPCFFLYIPFRNRPISGFLEHFCIRRYSAFIIANHRLKIHTLNLLSFPIYNLFFMLFL